MPADFPRGDPFNVGQMYTLFAEAIRTGRNPHGMPTFDTAVDLHRFLDTIRQSSMRSAVADVCHAPPESAIRYWIRPPG